MRAPFMSKRFVVIGCDATVGRALMNTLERSGAAVYGTSRRTDANSPRILPLDLRDGGVSLTLPDVDVAFFCAAITSFAECRQNPERARTINVTAPSNIARHLVARGTRVVFLSTSAVFDWTTPNVTHTASVCPTTVYGRLKAEAETEFLNLGSATSVIRFGKILASNHKLFTSWIHRLSSGASIEAFSDLYMAPIALKDAISALLALAASAEGGIYQLSGTRDISYFEAARHLAAKLGRDPALVVETKAVERGIPSEELTRFSSLDSSRLVRLTGRHPPDPFDAIDTAFLTSLDSQMSHEVKSPGDHE